jgi:nitrogen fixation/metabolism regulation signal transduction histidine kinase
MTSHTNNGNEQPAGQKRFRRRQYLIDRRRQLAATFRIAGLVLVLLIMVNGLLAWQSYSTTNAIEASNPFMAERIREIDQRNVALTAGISLIILAMVVVRSIMYTHRTAGAVYRVSMCLEEVADSNFNVSLRLRDNDNLRELEAPFNTMVENLRNRAEENRQAMLKIADEIEEHGGKVDADMLRRLAERT